MFDGQMLYIYMYYFVLPSWFPIIFILLFRFWTNIGITRTCLSKTSQIKWGDEQHKQKMKEERNTKPKNFVGGTKIEKRAIQMEIGVD